MQLSMHTFIQRPTNRSITISTDGFHVIIQLTIQEDLLTGTVTIRLSPAQARQLAKRELLSFNNAAPAPKGPFVELWSTPLPDGSSHIAISYSPTPNEADVSWLGIYLSPEDYLEWHSALLLSASRIG
jgi:hypothetical protein